MADTPILHITIYTMMARDMVNAAVPAPMTPPLAELHVEIELGRSTQSEPFPEQARFIMLRPDVACCIAFGDDPEAIDGVHPVDAGETRWYGVNPGQRVAVTELS